MQLQEYHNEYNLQFKPENGNTPYCCCSNGNICFASPDASNLTYNSCIFQCSLRFMICAGLTNITMEAETGKTNYSYCYESVVETAPPLIIFGCSSSDCFFPSQYYHPQFIFPLENYSQIVST